MDSLGLLYYFSLLVLLKFNNFIDLKKQIMNLLIFFFSLGDMNPIGFIKTSFMTQNMVYFI